MVDATEALLRVILDDPDDVVARRVYADALIGEGDPRGELISVQCAVEDAPPTERGELLRRERELLAAHEKTWTAPFAGAVWYPVFQRGFIDRAVVNTKKFVPIASALFDREPVTTLHVRDLTRANAQTLGEVPGLARLRSLAVVESSLGAKGTVALFPRPLPHLARLNLYQAGIDDEALEHLAATVLPGLERLNLAGTRLTGQALGRLLADARLAKLRYLSLDWMLPGAAGARFLAEHLALPALTHLNLSSSKLENDDLARLAGNPVARGLVGLRLENNALSGAGAIEALAPLTRLEVLDLSTNAIHADGVAALAKTTAPLRVLRLYQCRIDDDQLRALATARLPLRRLDLGYGSFGEPGLRAIGAAGWPLETLELWACKVGDAGAAALAAADFTATLRELSIGYNALTDAGVQALAAANWPRLERLSFRGDAITTAGVRALAASTTLPALRTLKLEDMKVSKPSVRPLVERGVRVL